MKVYELMNELAQLPSGAEVVCTTTLTVDELKSGNIIGDDEYGKTMYSTLRELDSVEVDDNQKQVYLDF